MSRQQGYYWVNYKSEWKIAEYGEFYDWLGDKEYGWHLSGACESYCEGEYCKAPIFSDSDFSEINENRIPAPNELTLPTWDSLTPYKEGDRLLIDGKEVIVGKTYDMDDLINDGII